MPGRRIAHDVADVWARNGRDGRVFHVVRKGEAFHAVLQLLPVLQIHFRSHADIYSHFISLICGILRHSELSRALFQILPVPEFYFRSNTRDRKWNANKSVSLSPAIISFQCRLRASVNTFGSGVKTFMFYVVF